jgi:hypothetical protein
MMRTLRRRLSRVSARLVVAMACVLMPGYALGAEYHGQVLFGGIPVPGAEVTVLLGDKHVSTVTDSQGLYQFLDLADGTWKVHIAMRGFKDMDGEAVVSSTSPQGSWELDLLSLETMMAGAHAAAPEPAALIPRTPLPPATTLRKPASTADAAAPPPLRPPDETSEASSDGLLVNGSENNAATSKYSIAPAFGNRRPGVKSLFTGSAGVIVDNSVFDAKPYSLTGLALPKASYSRLSGVVTLGGPVKIPRLLPRGPNFFVGYQWTRSGIANTQTGLVPTAAERNGDLSGVLNSLGQPMTIYNPATGSPFSGAIPVSAQAAALLKLYPLPNLPGSSRYNYQTQVLNNTHTDSLQSRLDKSIGRRDSIYGGFAFNSSRADSVNLFNFRDVTNTLGWNGNIHWSHRLPHNVIANLGFTVSRLRTDVKPNFADRANVSGDAGIGGNAQDALNWGPPTLVFASGITALTDAESAFNRNRTDQSSVSAQWIHRKHTVTFGGDFRRQEFNEFGQQNPRGTFTFTGVATQASGTASTSASRSSGSDFADFLLGVPDASALAFGNPDKYFRQSVSDLYLADDWRVRPDLTINSGMRYDYGAPMTELFGRLVNLDVTPGYGAQAPVIGSSPKGPLTGTAYPASLVRPDRLGVEPRIGVSWRPLPASTVVVRAGYGIYDDTSVYLSAAQQMSQQAPLSKSVSVANGPACPLTLANGFLDCAGTTADTFAIDPNFRVGYAQTWQLAVQRDLPGALVMSATYLGIKGTRGEQEFLPNTYAPGATDPCPGCPKGFVYRTSNGNSTRESGQIQLRRRLRSGVAGSLQYTFSKSLDNDSEVGAQGHISTVAATTEGSAGGSGTSSLSPTVAQNWLDLRKGERGLSSFDQRHFLKLQLQYTSGMGMQGGTLMSGWRGRLLKQWTAETSISAGSGLPETPVYYEAVPSTGVTGTVRPNVTGASVYRVSATPAGYFLNASAYAAPTHGQWGTARKNSIIGPGQFSMDGSVSRTFKLRDPVNFDVRLDATNLLNHVLFTTWNSTVNSTTFGLPAGVNGMRSLQVTGRLRF